jgi:hypothetical protein
MDPKIKWTARGGKRALTLNGHDVAYVLGTGQWIAMIAGERGFGGCDRPGLEAGKSAALSWIRSKLGLAWDPECPNNLAP